MTKDELRERYKAKRRKLSEYELSDGSLAIANQLLKMDLWDKTYFHVFLPIESMREVDTEIILHLLAGKNKKVVVSRSDFDTQTMALFLLDDDTKIKKNHYGIPEPQNGKQISPDKLDVVFVPLLAYDEKGYRVGYGKGFYDKFLPLCRKDVVKVGLSLFDAEPVIADVWDQDIRLDYCVTPDKVYAF